MNSDEILSKRRKLSFPEEIVRVISEIIEIACNADERGLRLAAAFDLLASVEYYQAVTNRGWTYCDTEPYMLFYPYTNACPRCIGNDHFKFTRGNKPESAQIGVVTAELLCQMLELLFKRNGRNVEVREASEPIDAVIYDKDSKNIVIAEVKSAPMMTLPLAMKCEKMTETTPDGNIEFVAHSVFDNPTFKESTIGIYLPKTIGLPELFVPLDLDWKKSKPFYVALHKLLDIKKDFFDTYYTYWSIAYDAYSRKDRSINMFWLTNGCGQPFPRPNDWPARKGAGYESVSDGKTSVGMDRTDDIKKAIYQVLKLGTTYKPHNPSVKTAIISNIHAVRHYAEYLTTIEDVIWALNHDGGIKCAAQLDPETPVYNLFDGILSFTKSEIHDDWIKELYKF